MLKSKFDLGQIVATNPALLALEANNQSAHEFVKRHSECEWGEDLCDEDKELNDQALLDGSRLMSSYILQDGKTKLWIITEAADDDGKRIATLLLPVGKVARYFYLLTIDTHLMDETNNTANQEEINGPNRKYPPTNGEIHQR